MLAECHSIGVASCGFVLSDGIGRNAESAEPTPIYLIDVGPLKGPVPVLAEEEIEGLFRNTPDLRADKSVCFQPSLQNNAGKTRCPMRIQLVERDSQS